MNTLLYKAAELLQKKQNIIALTGAGISVESGIPPFRGKGGLWEAMDPMEFAHIRAFRKDPARVWAVLLVTMKQVLEKAAPNPGHSALARLEDMGRLQGIVTQNIDGLHQAAGSRRVIEFHGSFARVLCTDCGSPLSLTDLSLKELPPRCACGGILRPDCVFFGENIPETAMREAKHLALSCDLMMVVGTSAEVWPAAELPRIAKAAGATVLEINPESTPLSPGVSDLFLKGPAGVLLPRLLESMQIP